MATDRPTDPQKKPITIHPACVHLLFFFYPFGLFKNGLWQVQSAYEGPERAKGIFSLSLSIWPLGVELSLPFFFLNTKYYSKRIKKDQSRYKISIIRKNKVPFFFFFFLYVHRPFRLSNSSSSLEFDPFWIFYQIDKKINIKGWVGEKVLMTWRVYLKTRIFWFSVWKQQNSSDCWIISDWKRGKTTTATPDMIERRGTFISSVRDFVSSSSSSSSSLKVAHASHWINNKAPQQQ